jgi:hypothetical protein
MNEGYDPKKVLQKYALNDLRGRGALEAGTPTILSERPRMWSQSFSINLLFSKSSEAQIRAVADRIDAIGKRLGISFLLAGRDYPIHSALQAGSYMGNPEDRALAYDRVYDDAFARTAPLARLTPEYKLLIVNKEAISLNALHIPKEIAEFRASVSAKAAVESMRPQNMDNITLARIVHAPNDSQERVDALRALERELTQVRFELAQQPIRAHVSRVFFGQVMDDPGEK